MSTEQIIKKTNNGYKGGLLKGKTHEKGGIDAVVVTDEDKPVELEDKEIIVNANTSTSDTLHEFDGKQKTPREIISDLNVEGGGVPIYNNGSEIGKGLGLNKRDIAYLKEELNNLTVFGELGSDIIVKNTTSGANISLSPNKLKDFDSEVSAYLILSDILGTENEDWHFNYSPDSKYGLFAYPRSYMGKTPILKRGGLINDSLVKERTLLLNQNKYNGLKNILNQLAVFGKVDQDVFINNSDSGAEITLSHKKASEFESMQDALYILNDILASENEDWLFDFDHNSNKGVYAFPKKKKSATTSFKNGGIIESDELDIFNDKFFTQNPDKVLGEQVTVSTRFGKNATNYKGDLELLDKITIEPKHTKKTRTGKKHGGQKAENNLDIQVGQGVSENNIDNAIVKSKEQIADKTIEKLKEVENTMYDLPDGESVLSFEDVYNYVNPDGTKLNNLSKSELEVFIWYQEKTGRKLSAKWYGLIGRTSLPRGTFNDEDIKRWVNEGVLFYTNGELAPGFIYLSGDLYSKKNFLTGWDKENIISQYGQAVLDNQIKAMDNAFAQVYDNRLLIVPTKFNEKDESINKLIIKPTSKLAKNYDLVSLKDEKIFKVVKSKASKTLGQPNFDAERNSSEWSRDKFEALSIYNAFIYWLKFYTSEFKYKKGGIDWQTIRDFYLNKKQYNADRDHDRGNYKRKCSINQAEGDRLFDYFLQNWLLKEDQEKLENNWNKKFFGHKPIDYDKIPFALSCTDKELDGSPIEFRFEKRDAVAFTFGEGTGLLAYQVGTGKTRSAILTIGQFLDAGYSKRPFIVVPNQTYKQWLTEIRHLLPQYKINDLYNLSKDYLDELKGKGRWVLKENGQAINLDWVFEQKGQKYYGKNKLDSRLLTDVAVYNDIEEIEPYTITVLTYEGFKRLGFNEWTQTGIEMDMMRILEQGEENQSQKKSEKDHESKKATIAADIGRALQGRAVNIEDLGLDFIVLDEAHSAKKVFTRIKGDVKADGGREKNQYLIESGNRSAMALKTFCISQYLQKNNNGNNVLLLTATPFTNSPLEVFSMLSLISYQKLKYSELESLQTFFNNYVQVENQLVINSKLRPERKDVFVGYNNLPALQQLIGRFMSYKEAGKPDHKGRTIKLKRPDKWVLPLKYEVKAKVKSLLPPEEQIKTNLPLSGLQEVIMADIRQYVEGKISIDELVSNSISTLNDLGIEPIGGETEIEDHELKIYSKTELKSLSVDDLKKVLSDYGFEPDKFKSAKKDEIINYIKDNEPEADNNELVDTEAVEENENELDDKEKQGVKVLRGVNYARSLALSPYLYFNTVLLNSGRALPEPDYKSYIETSPKLVYTMECIRSVKEYHESKGEPISGQIIYADRGKDYFKLIKEYLVKELGYKDHEVGMIKSGSKKDEIKNKFLGQKYDENLGKFANIPDDERMKIVIGSSSILEGINLQRYTSVLYNLFLPWNPTDVVQLEGRAWRQGNVFGDVRIVVPLMDNSMDIFMFQKLEEKTERINQIWNIDGNSNTIRLEEFNPVELKKELITDPMVLAKLESEIEGELIADKIQEIRVAISEAERVVEYLNELSDDNYSYTRTIEIVNYHLGEKERGTDNLLKAYKKLQSTGKDQHGNKIAELHSVYGFDQLVIANRGLKRLQKEFLIPNKLKADIKTIQSFSDYQNSEIEALNERGKKLLVEDYLKERASLIVAEREKNKYKPANVTERIAQFKSLNYLLSNREIVEQTCEKFTKLDLDMCPPMDKDGNRLVDKKSIDKLELCLKELPQTKTMHTINGTDIYTPERTELHDSILTEIRSGAVCKVREKPIAILTGGLPGSGKSTFLNQYSDYLTSDNIFSIDADEVRAKLPEYKGWNANQTHKETSDIVAKLLEGCKDGIPCKYDLLYDGTMNKAKNYIPLINKIKSIGYKVFIIFIEVPPEVTRERVLQRYKRSGRYVPRFVIEAGIKAGLQAFDTLKSMVDGYMLVDGETREIIEVKGEEIPKDRNYFSSKPNSKQDHRVVELSQSIEQLWKKYA